MDTAQTAAETLVELGNLSQQLDNLQMLFFLFVLVVVVLGVITIMILWFTNKDSRADNLRQDALIKALADMSKSNDRRTVAFMQAVQVFRRTQIGFWKQNRAEHRYFTQVLNRMTVALKVSGILETQEVEKIGEE